MSSRAPSTASQRSALERLKAVELHCWASWERRSGLSVRVRGPTCSSSTSVSAGSDSCGWILALVSSPSSLISFVINFKTFASSVESQKDFHVKRLAELGLLITTTTTTTQRTTTTSSTTTSTTTHAPVRITIKERERLQTPAPQAPPEVVSRFARSCVWEFQFCFHPADLPPSNRAGSGNRNQLRRRPGQLHSQRALRPRQ